MALVSSSLGSVEAVNKYTRSYVAAVGRSGSSEWLAELWHHASQERFAPAGTYCHQPNQSAGSARSDQFTLFPHGRVQNFAGKLVWVKAFKLSASTAPKRLGWDVASGG